MHIPQRNLIKPTEFICLMASIMLLTALAIDIILPTFGAVRHHFGLGPESTATAQLVTFFFLGQIGQIFFGVLSDRYGRLPVLRVGFLLYIGGCITTVMAPGLAWLLVARFIMGLGAGALFVSAIACVRDRFQGSEMARIMSLILTIFLTVPIVAPLLGSAILLVGPWQVVFLTPASFAIVFFIWSFRLSESLSEADRQPLALASLIQSIRRVWSNRIFVRYTAITTILFAGFSSYIGSSERMVGTIYGRPGLFVFIFASVGIIMALFTFLNAKLVARFGARRTVRSLLTVYWILASILLGLTILLKGPVNMFIFFGLIALLQGINVAAEPNSSALALEPMGSMAGMAASIYGTSYLVVGALGGSFIDRLLVNSVTPLPVAYFMGGLAAMLLVRTAPKR
ncbi:multidrug effflux MFS transporter [Spirosoma sp. KCTC 42546]|uniref:MFS transporter n=1 Tax=Spirosoma sp. KCTC 42546 TaxID=2520506 RepID=UPI0011572948|nr:MFS transporter [Spirosoma sp. KCTC 42546]QDK82674.1 multidrug effflux MFS transporter [Spirosoma sp. KCTC 42546]